MPSLTKYAKGNNDLDLGLEFIFTYPFWVGVITLEGKSAEYRAANAWRNSNGA